MSSAYSRLAPNMVSLVVEVIEREIAAAGYHSTWKCLQAAEFGVPQRRERLFIVGAATMELLGQFRWPSGSSGFSLWDAISDLPEHNEAYIGGPSTAYQKRMRGEHLREAPSHHEPMRHTARIIERFKAIRYGENEAHVAWELQPKGRGGRPGKAYFQNSRRQHPDQPCSTVVASSHTNFIHPFFHRNFTVRELMRIQSFPDHFSLSGKRAVLSKKLSLRKGCSKTSTWISECRSETLFLHSLLKQSGGRCSSC